MQREYSAILASTKKSLNVCGLTCPQPLIKTTIFISDMANKELAVITCDDKSFELDLKVLAKKNNYKLLQIWDNITYQTYLIEK